MVKAVIFDMDGVIVDSEGMVSRSYEILIRKYGKEPIFNKNNLIHPIGVGREAYKQVFKDIHGLEESLEKLISERREIFWEIFDKEGIPVMPGFNKLLLFLKNKNIKMAVASNTSLSAVCKILKKIKAINYFKEIVSGENVKKYKPEPDIYLETAKKLDVYPEECLVIEDTDIGVVSGKSAGMKVVAVPNKYTNYQDFSKADLIVNSLEDIDWKEVQKLFF